MCYDLKIWFSGEKRKYIPLIGLCVFIVFQVLARGTQCGNLPDYLDALFQMFRGEAPYVLNLKENQRTPFELSAVYVIFHFYLAWLISYYPLREMGNMGKLTILKHGRTRNWWLGKCLWNVCIVTSYYVAAWLTLADGILCLGKLRLDGNLPILMQIIDSEKVNFEALMSLPKKDIVVICFVLPLVVSIGLSMLQMMLSLILKPAYCLIFVLGLLVSSSFYCNHFLIGNYLMYLRNETILYESGVGAVWGIWYGLALTLVSVLGGLWILRRKDIF